MVLYSLNKLYEVNTSNPEDHINIIENGINEWSKINNIEEKGKDYNSTQIEIIQRIMAIAENSSVEDFQLNIVAVEKAIANLREEEQLELFIMVEMIKGACAAISDFETPNFLQQI